MSVSGISSNNDYMLTLMQQNQNASKQQNNGGSIFADLFSSSALDVDGARDSDDGAFPAGNSSKASSGSDTTSLDAFASDLQSLLAAAQSGNMTSAQTSADAVESDLGFSASSASVSDTSTSSTELSSTNTDTSGNQFIDDLSSLISAVQSGDMGSAQTAAGSVQQDLQAMGPLPPPSSSADGNDSGAASGNSASGSPASTQFNTFLSDVSDLLTTTSSNDMTSAQTAATKVQNDLKAMASPSGDGLNGASSTTGADAPSSDTLAGQMMQSLMNAIANSAQSSQSSMGLQLQPLPEA